MNSWLEECSQILKDKNIPVSEQGKTFEIVNPDNKEVIKTKVDGCLIDDNEKKCDYYFEVNQDKKQFFVELKGTNLKKALEQIENTLRIFQTKYHLKQNICGCIVLSRFPKTDTTLQTEQKRFMKTWNLRLNIKSRIMTEKI